MYSTRYDMVSLRSLNLNRFEPRVWLNGEPQHMCWDSGVHWRCIGLAVGQCATNIGLPESAC